MDWRPGDFGWPKALWHTFFPFTESRDGVSRSRRPPRIVIQACRFGCFVGAFEQDQHVWRLSPFQAPHRRHRHVSAAMGPISGKNRFTEIAAPQS